MTPRITIHDVATLKSLIDTVYQELELISLRKPQQSINTQAPLIACCDALSKAGAVTLLAQHRVRDPDFLSEYSSYYSKQFTEVNRLCTRLHFFKQAKLAHSTPLEFIDSTSNENYLGFITLRPIIMSPVGASILSHDLASGFIRSADNFPVNIMGKELTVYGTPFMQQDNAVGACAQASIWMALRTLRKKEGDRAHNPAQITDAATRYNANGRTKPNRQGLTQIQMIEAIRSAEYSPHSIWLGHWLNKGLDKMDPADVDIAMQKIHPYIESEIPIVLILNPKNGAAHAVVVVGHTWDEKPTTFKNVDVITSTGLNLKFSHAASWIPELIINNDNSGPYLNLPASSGGGNNYSMEQIVSAMPLLPSDVFMSAEEALTVGLAIIGDLYQGFSLAKRANLEESASKVAIRILLVEKRKLRKWAATTSMAKELKDELRTMDLPKRVWVLELHLKENYGLHGTANTPTLVGFVLIDPTGDTVTNSILMLYLNKDYPVDIPAGSYILLFRNDGTPINGTQIETDTGPLEPIRN